jgi:hypothetical protein
MIFPERYRVGIVAQPVPLTPSNSTSLHFVGRNCDDSTRSTNMENDAITLDDLYTVEDLAKRYPKTLPAKTLAWQVRNREQNGLAPAVVHVGKRLLISKSRYEHWLATQAGRAAE